MINFNSSWDDRDMWKAVLLAAVSTGLTIDTAVTKADDALVEFRTRMEKPVKVAVVPSELDPKGELATVTN